MIKRCCGDLSFEQQEQLSAICTYREIAHLNSQAHSKKLLAVHLFHGMGICRHNIQCVKFTTFNCVTTYTLTFQQSLSSDIQQ